MITPQQDSLSDAKARASRLKLMAFDVDGVLTDGGLYFSEQGESLKRFSTLDGHGLKLLALAGITPAVITGRDSRPLRLRLEALGVRHVRYGTEDKKPAAQSILDELELGWHQAAAMGDDWPDLPVMHACALACAPPGAHAQARDLAHHVTTAPPATRGPRAWPRGRPASPPGGRRTGTPRGCGRRG